VRQRSREKGVGMQSVLSIQLKEARVKARASAGER
jgi:hypothetical protein